MREDSPEHDYEFLCSKCNSAISVDIDSFHYTIKVDACDKCLAAEREDGHYEGYLERDEEAFQEIQLLKGEKL